MMPKLIPADGQRFNCSACDQTFSPPAIPRGATVDDGRSQGELTAAFSESAEKADLPFRPNVRADRITHRQVAADMKVSVQLYQN